MKKISVCLSFVLFLLVVACVKNKVDYANNTQINGLLTYEDPEFGKKAAPAGTLVNIYYNSSKDPVYTFTTTDSGKYVYQPQSKGSYLLSFSFRDTLLSYNKSLVEKTDLDTTRDSSSTVIYYTNSKPLSLTINSDQKTYSTDVDMSTMTTGLRLTVVDAQNNPVPNAKVCIYSNKSFADQNAPYCGGCLAYLNTNLSGVIVFVGLSTGTYYINARATIGVLTINNQWSTDMKSATVSTTGSISLKMIMLK